MTARIDRDSSVSDYAGYLDRKAQIGTFDGFEPVWMPDYLFDFQASLVSWKLRKGRCAGFEDCGLGKTPMALVWAENVVRKTNGRVLILTFVAVASQIQREGAEKFGIQVTRSHDGKGSHQQARAARIRLDVERKTTVISSTALGAEHGSTDRHPVGRQYLQSVAWMYRCVPSLYTLLRRCEYASARLEGGVGSR